MSTYHDADSAMEERTDEAIREAEEAHVPDLLRLIQTEDINESQRRLIAEVIQTTDEAGQLATHWAREELMGRTEL